MKVFIKSLLVISLLSGSVSYAGSVDSPDSLSEDTLGSLTMNEKQERLEKLTELKIKMVNKQLLIEDFYKKNGAVLKDVDHIIVGSIVAGVLFQFVFKSGTKEESKIRALIKTISGLAGSTASAGVGIAYVAQLHDSNFNKSLAQSSDDEIRVLYKTLSQEIIATDKKIVQLEESMMESL
ncbi:MAG: hypothetical protein V4596_13780 [Bdellovibrionota bacterium]